MNTNDIETHLYLQILDQFPNPIWRAGTDAKCNFFNKNWLEFTGRTMEQEMGDGWAEGVHPEDLKPCVDTYLSSFKQKKPFKMEYRLKHHDGTYHWLLDFGSPFFAKDGTFLGYIGACYDNNESHRRHQESERLTQLMVGRELKMVEMKKKLEQLEKQKN